MTAASAAGSAAPGPAAGHSAESTAGPAASKSQRAYHWIKERIARREFTPGYRLVLGTIAQSLEMSVVPVREAVRLLEAEGLVEFERNVGARVAFVDESEYVCTMQTLGIVEGAATALAAPLLSEEDLHRAQQLNERMADMLDDLDAHAFTVLNQRFHTVLFEQCPNSHLLGLVERGWSRLSRLRDSTFAFVPERSRRSVEEHTQLLELIRSGAAPLEIELATRNHRWRTVDALVDARHPHAETTDGGTP